MAKNASLTRFQARLRRPIAPEEGGAWTFLNLSQEASEALPSRGQAAVEGFVNGAALLSVAQPDGQGGHWLKVGPELQQAAKAEAGDLVQVELAPSDKWPEPEVPEELQAALAATPKAQAVWADITTAARTDWVFWVTSAKKAETRTKRIAAACDMLGGGKRRVCCFDRSGVYSKSQSCPLSEDAP